MDKYIGNELDKRYDEYKADSDGRRTKSVIDLVLQAYLPENAKVRPEKLDPKFRAFAISQIRLFVFVGHDAASSTICYILHLLAANPNILVKVHAEHDRLLGSDLSAPPILKEQAHLTNDLTYTTAVIKEVLRLFPPGGASRAGSPSADLVDNQGNCYPTKDCAAVFTVRTEIYRAPAYWDQTEELIPERWLAECRDERQSTKGAYRAFEIGPRNCIAQGYVMTGLRAIVAYIVRQFDFTPAYDGWDRLHPSRGLRTYRGERAYQIEEGAAHPVDHYPCRVSVRGIQNIYRL